MDTYQHVRSGVAYPPMLINMGLNDPRIAPWQPAKLMARLEAAGDRTALLRVDAGGHGVGASRSQYDELFTDFIAFVFWHSGVPGWSPLTKAGHAIAR
jgi:prolyl oligopeptidase